MSGLTESPGNQQLSLHFSGTAPNLTKLACAPALAATALRGTVGEAQEIVNRARMWRWKPYGEVTLRFAQDGQGAPVELMQDPLHYPHGTKFMAPGPLGQVHPVPDDR